MSNVKLTPMMEQYRAIKAEIPQDAILLFRLGDFYEMFFEDAVKSSSIMDIVLTKRGGVPMCGFPYHNLDGQLPKLLNAGVKVAIAEQTEDPKQAKGVVKRAVTRIITPGTIIDQNVLESKKSNFLTAISKGKKNRFGLAALDVSTGELRVTEIDNFDKLKGELLTLGVRECLLPDAIYKKWEEKQSFPDVGLPILWTPLENSAFNYDNAIQP